MDVYHLPYKRDEMEYNPKVPKNISFSYALAKKIGEDANKEGIDQSELVTRWILRGIEAERQDLPNAT